MAASSAHLFTCSVVSPYVSLPNTNAAVCECATSIARARRLARAGRRNRHFADARRARHRERDAAQRFIERGVHPRVAEHVGGARRAPLGLFDREISAAIRDAGSESPIVFIARAAAPMLPGWLVSHRTMRTFLSGSMSRMR